MIRHTLLYLPLLLSVAVSVGRASDRTSSTSCPTTWGSRISAVTDRRYRHTESRFAGRQRRAFHAVLQHGPLLPHACLSADRTLSAPGRRGPHDERPRLRWLSRRSESQLRDHRRSARSRPAIATTCPANGTSRRSCKPKSEADKHNWPLQRGFDRFYGTIIGAGSFFDPYTLTRDNEYISPYRRSRSTSRSSTTTPMRSATTPCGSSASITQQNADQPFFMYVSLHGRPLAHACVGKGYCQVQRQVRRGLPGDPRCPLSAHDRIGSDRRGVDGELADSRTSGRSRSIASGTSATWKSMRR